MSRPPTTPAIVFTKEELRTMEKSAEEVLIQWRNGYHSATRVYAARSALVKIREALYPAKVEP